MARGSKAGASPRATSSTRITRRFGCSARKDPMSERRFLTAIRRREDFTPPEAFPWSVPLIRDLQAIQFSAAVTFFVGENGSGKSTVLEGVATRVVAGAAARAP